MKLNLADRNFTCSGVEESALYFSWTCSRETALAELRVEYYSRSLVSVDFINAGVLQFAEPDDELAASFLGFMATMPYDGAEPDKARAWVENTLPTIREAGDVRTATFGGVQFQLFGAPTARILQMGYLAE